MEETQLEVEQYEKVQYIPYQSLQKPEINSISQPNIDLRFNSKEWFIQFQTLTHLRQANKYYSSIFLNQLLLKNYKNIIAQVENLRSNNSKEALNLLSEIFEFQNLEKVDLEIIRPLVATLFTKSVSEKGFLKSQALRAINFIPNRWNPYILQELCNQTQAANGQISELAIKIMSDLLENYQINQVDAKFLKNLSFNLNGKRAVVQKKAKQILRGLKARSGEEKLQKIIEQSSTELLEEESNTLRRQLKKQQEKSKANGSLKEFLKAKKQQTETK